MIPTTQLIEQFYRSFQQLDAKGMNSCYHPNILFYDPVFQDLRGEEAKAMWTMLCAAASSFTVTFSDVKADNEYGSCHWRASYVFSKTGRQVVNDVSSRFRFQDGLIIEHMDDFDLWKWSRQALGWSGTLLGWTPIVKNKVRKSARKNLDIFMHKSISG